MSKREAFVAEFGADLLEELFANVYGDTKSENIWIAEKHRIDAINQEGRAFIDLGDKEIVVDWRDGNWNGSEILDYSLGDLPNRKYYATVCRLAIDEFNVKNLELAKQIFAYWQKQPWFRELEGKYSYDNHFAPGLKTTQHYNEIAAKKGMRWVFESVEVDP